MGTEDCHVRHWVRRPNPFSETWECNEISESEREDPLLSRYPVFPRTHPLSSVLGSSNRRLGQQLRLGSDHRALAHIHSSLRWTSCVRSRKFRKNSPDKLQLCEVFGPGSLASLQQHIYGWIGVAYWGQVGRIFSHTQPPRLGVQIDCGRCPRQPDAPQVPQISSHGHEQVSGTPSVRMRVGRSQR